MRAGLLALAVIVALGVGTLLLVASRRGAHQDRMRSDLAQDIAQGGLAGLARAQARARHLMLSDPNDREAVATLAFANAVLAVEYGLDSAGDVQNLVGRSREPSSPSPSETVAGLTSAARALLFLHAGDREGAARQAAAAAQIAPGVPHPLYALGRIRARAGDLAGATHALEAALSRDPGFGLAQVAWAEAKLDGGDPEAARATLRKVLARPGSSEDPRALLLLGETERALGTDSTPVERPVCDKLTAAGNEQPSPSRWPPAAVRAGCALARAAEARAHGRREEALASAEEAGRLASAEPRLLTRTSLLLAQLGEIDWAAGLLERARRLNPTETPAMKWVSAALDLGRGHAPPLPRGPRPPDPEIRLVIARDGLSAGGLGGLRTALGGLGAEALKHDADLAMLAALVSDHGGRAGGPGGAPALSDVVPASDPFRAYLEGVRANLAEDLPEAARRFAHALTGHGDACRAAGEYIAALKLLKRPDDPNALAPLRGENTSCVNIR